MEKKETEDKNRFGSSGILKKCWQYFQENKLLALSLAAVVLGLCLGLILKTYVHLTELDQLYIGFPGELLMRMLQLVTVPLIVTTVITGVSGLSVEASRRIALRAGIYFVGTTVLAVTTGLILVLTFKPGADHSVTPTVSEDEESFSTLDALLDLIRNMTPANLILACFQQYHTERVELDFEELEQNFSLETNGTELRLVGQHIVGANTLGLIVWSFIFGVTLNGLGEEGKVLVDTLTVLNETIKCAVDLILGYLPFGVLFLIASHVIEVNDMETTVKLLRFMVVVLVGLIIHGVIVLPLIYVLFTRRNPLTVIRRISPALMTALAFSSSSATLPLTFQCCEERLKINKRITRFMLPIGTNISMDGTALYEVVAVVFIAQLNHIHLNFSEIITLSVTAAVSSVGAAGIRATGAVTTLFVLTAVGLPAKEASILVIVEWILDHCNTVLNVMGDCIGVAVVYQLSKAEVEEMEKQEKEMTRWALPRTRSKSKAVLP